MRHFDVPASTMRELGGIGRTQLATEAGRPGLLRRLLTGRFAGTPLPRFVAYGALPFYAHNFVARQQAAEALAQQAAAAQQHAGASTTRALLTP
jgi:hypothetical protein